MKTCPLFSSELLSAIPENIHLQSISDQTFQSLTAINEFLENIGLYFSGKRRKEEHCQRLKQNITILNAAEFKENLDNYRKECDYLKSYRANIALKNLLTTTIWNKWEQLSSKTQINQLQMFWKKNSETNHLSHEALLIIAQDILPFFEQFYQLTVIERKYYQASLPKKVIESLKTYQQEVRAYIDSLKRQICDAMLARLQVISKSNNIYQGDVNFYVIARLGHLGVNLTEPINRKYKILSQSHFVSFHRYISQQGSPQQKTMLYRLPWFENDGEFLFSESNGQLMIMPSATPIKNKIFSLLPWIEKFFDWLSDKQNFFYSKFHLLAQIRLQEKNHHIEQCSLENLLNEDNWRRLNLFENTLLAEHSSLEMYLSSFWNQVFHPTLYASLIAFKRCVLKALGRNLENKMAYAELLAEQLRTRLVFDLEAALMSLNSLKEFVKAIIKDIENALTKTRLEKSVLNRWERTKCLLNIYLSSDRKICEKKENAAPQNDKELQSKPNFVSIDVAIKDIIAKACPNNIFDLKVLDSNLVSLQRLFELRNSKIESDISFWKHFLICYLNTCITLGVENSLLKDVKGILVKFGHREVVSSASRFNFFQRDMNLTAYISCRSELIQRSIERSPAIQLSQIQSSQRVA